jgi:hypothetical protein
VLFFGSAAPKRLKETMLAFAFHKGESRIILAYKTKAAVLERVLARQNLKPSGSIVFWSRWPMRLLSSSMP